VNGSSSTIRITDNLRFSAICRSLAKVAASLAAADLSGSDQIRARNTTSVLRSAPRFFDEFGSRFLGLGYSTARVRYRTKSAPRTGNGQVPLGVPSTLRSRAVAYPREHRLSRLPASVPSIDSVSQLRRSPVASLTGLTPSTNPKSLLDRDALVKLCTNGSTNKTLMIASRATSSPRFEYSNSARLWQTARCPRRGGVLVFKSLADHQHRG